MTDVIGRIVERNRLLWIALNGPGTRAERDAALLSAFDSIETRDPRHSMRSVIAEVEAEAEARHKEPLSCPDCGSKLALNGRNLELIERAK